MPAREFDIVIKPNGEVDLTITGYKGKRCHEALKMIADLVGQDKSQRETNEFYEPEEHVRYFIDQRQ